MDFVRVCLDELYDNIQEKLRYNSLSTRLSKLEHDDFQKYMKEVEPKSNKSRIIEVDHEAQMRQAKGN